MSDAAVPVLMYHKLGPPIPGWAWSHLCVPAAVFADHLDALARAGWRTAGLAELHAHVAGERRLPPRTAVLTFDDGYVDTWSIAVPLLARHGFSATVFVNPDFVDPRPVVRPAGETVGFASWDELRAAVRGGHLEVQSHLMTHTWLPTGARVVDVHRPGAAHYWLDWNADPSNKPFYLSDATRTVVPYGTPVYEHDKAARAVQACPDPAEAEHMAEFVAERGGASFFDEPRWRASYDDELARYRRDSPPDFRRESEAERLARLHFEIAGSRRVLEEQLDVPVDFLAWPGGGYDEVALREARAVYRATTISSHDRDRLGARNAPGDDPRVIARLGCPTVEAAGRGTVPGGRYLVRFLEEYRGGVLARRTRQAMKAFLVCGLGLRLVRS